MGGLALADRPRTPAQFLILGSASPELLQQGSETLAGRIAFVEMGGFSLDDAYTAGRLVAAAQGDIRPRTGLNDAAIAALDLVRRYGDDWERPLRRSRAGRELLRLGFGDDIAAASRMDAYPVLPHFHERRVTLVAVPV